MNVGVIIAAAGRGERFGRSSKLDQDVGGRALLLRTVELFTRRDEVRSIVVAGPADDFDEFKEKYGPALSFHGATVVPGSRESRCESVRLAMEAIPPECTHIAVHDAARPAAGTELLTRLFEAARTLAAVVPAVRITSTIKRIDADSVALAGNELDATSDAILGDAGHLSIEATPVLETVDRRNLVEVQTPQIFDAALLRRAYAQQDFAGVTDDASLVERLGETVHTVPGDTTNIKVTTSDDLRLVRAILGVKAPAERPAHKRF